MLLLAKQFISAKMTEKISHSHFFVCCLILLAAYIVAYLASMNLNLVIANQQNTNVPVCDFP